MNRRRRCVHTSGPLPVQPVAIRPPTLCAQLRLAPSSLPHEAHARERQTTLTSRLRALARLLLALRRPVLADRLQHTGEARRVRRAVDRLGEAARLEGEDGDRSHARPLERRHRLAHLLEALVRRQVRGRRRRVQAHLLRRLPQHLMVRQRPRALKVAPSHRVRHGLALAGLALRPQHQPVRVHRVAQLSGEVKVVAGGLAQLAKLPRGLRAVQGVDPLAPRFDRVVATRVEKEGRASDGEVEDGGAALLVERLLQPRLADEAVRSHRVGDQGDRDRDGKQGASGRAAHHGGVPE
mmetsp:Transcript_19680/g.62661  ORF Transcript_19680/g.62661 Transcript_19680/m.62661 type:complete len:295 (+) Transcript_19680:67-951(+)